MKTKKCQKNSNRIKNEIETINGGKTSEYSKHFMTTKFESDDEFPLNKQLEFTTMTIVVRSVFEGEGKFYPQVYLDQCFYELLTLEDGKIDISEAMPYNNTMHQKNVIFVIIGFLKILTLRKNLIFAIAVMI